MNTSITNLTPAIVQNRVIKVISEQFGVSKSEIKPDSNFTTDLGGDSLDMVELAMTLEDEFYIELPDEEAMKVVTVADAVALVEKYRD